MTSLTPVRAVGVFIAVLTAACNGAKAASPATVSLYAYPEGTVQARLYVSPNGSDGNPGSLSRPFRTPERARREAALIDQKSGDIVIYFRGGNYRRVQPLVLASGDSGRANYKVVYAGYGDEEPVFSGGDAISGWKQYDASKNIWVARVSSTLETRQLYVDGRGARRAGTTVPVTAFVKTSAGYSNSGSWKANGEILGWSNPADIEFVYTGVDGAKETPTSTP